MYHRQVARLLRNCGDGLPWHRVLAPRLYQDAPGSGVEQRLRLEMEGVRFAGKHVDLEIHQHVSEPGNSEAGPSLLTSAWSPPR